MIVLPCIEWVISSYSYVTFVFILAYFFSLIRALVGKRGNRK